MTALAATKTAARAITGATVNRDIVAPTTAPAHIVSTTEYRSFPRRPVPPASLLSTPMPTIVDVSTVVLSSWIPNWRAVAFWLPNATARPAIRISFVLSW